MHRGTVECESEEQEERERRAESLDDILDNPGEAQRRARRLWLENPHTRSAAVRGPKERLSRPYVYGLKEHRECLFALDYATGNLECKNREQAPAEDCRNSYCPHAELMRTRIVRKMHDKYAPGRKRRGVR